MGATRYQCSQCHTTIKGRGLEKHWGSKRCDELKASFDRGYAAAKTKALAGVMGL